MALPTCTEMPTPISTAGRMYFGITDLRIRAKSAKVLRSYGFEVNSSEPLVLSTYLQDDGLGTVLRFLADELTVEEFASIRVYVTADPAEVFNVATAVRMPSAPELAARLESEWLIGVLKEGSLQSHFQPVVEMRTGQVIGHECLLRAFDPLGHAIAPARVFATARSLELLSDGIVRPGITTENCFDRPFYSSKKGHRHAGLSPRIRSATHFASAITVIIGFTPLDAGKRLASAT